MPQTRVAMGQTIAMHLNHVSIFSVSDHQKKSIALGKCNAL